MREVWGFVRGFAAVMARPAGDPRTFSPRYFGERPLILGGKAVMLGNRVATGQTERFAKPRAAQGATDVRENE